VIETALSAESIDTQALIERIHTTSAGAVVVFEGRTRAEPELKGLHYEAFEERAANQLEAFAREIAERPGIDGVAAVHRTGDVGVGEVSVVVVVCAGHRAEAFEAAHDLIDRIKAEAAIWKKEIFASHENWVGLAQ
jgi:molybdopterin synthase catalytic subunit